MAELNEARELLEKAEGCFLKFESAANDPSITDTDRSGRGSFKTGIWFKGVVGLGFRVSGKEFFKRKVV